MTTKSKTIYEHTQRAGWILRGPIVIAISVSAYMGFGYHQYEGFAVIAILLMIAYLFGSLTVSLDSERLRLRFGPGPVRRSFRIAEIKSVGVVRNKWYYGVGIHPTPHGMLYNIGGLDGIELLLLSGRKVRIGTDEPRRLCELIIEQIREKQKT